jgi:DNA repair protein RecO (recombination protein O)
MSRGELTDALVLRAVDYRDADRIVTLLTERHGKIAALARSARKSRKRFGGSLEPYALIEAEVRMGRGEVGGLSHARVKRSFVGILGDLRRITAAGAALELVREALPVEEPHPDVLALVISFFEHIEASAKNEEELLLSFSARVLALLGFEPNLDTCARCSRRAAAGQAALFEPSLGSVVCRSCGGAPLKICGEARRLLGQSATEAWFEAAGAPWDDAVRTEIRRSLAGLVEHSIGRRLKAADAFAQILVIPRLSD